MAPCAHRGANGAGPDPDALQVADRLGETLGLRFVVPPAVGRRRAPSDGAEPGAAPGWGRELVDVIAAAHMEPDAQVGDPVGRLAAADEARFTAAVVPLTRGRGVPEPPRRKGATGLPARAPRSLAVALRRE